MLGSPFASLRRSAVVFSGDLGSPSPSAAGRVGGERSQHRRPVDLPLARGRHACSTLHITSANLPLARLPDRSCSVSPTIETASCHCVAALLLLSGFCRRVRGINNSDTVVSVTCDDTSDGVCVFRTDTVGRWHQQQWHDDISKRNGRWHVEASDKGGRGTRASSPASTVCFVYFLVPVLTLKLCLSRNFGIRKLLTVSSCLATEKNKKIT